MKPRRTFALSRSVLVLSLLVALSAQAQEETASPSRWGLLVSAGGGGFGEPLFSNSNHFGWLVAAHALVTTPFGLEVGPVFQRGASSDTAWGTLPGDVSGSTVERARDDFWGLGLEARYRFRRTSRVSPWLGLRLGWSQSTKLDTDVDGSPRFYSGSSVAAALGAGLDLQVEGKFGLVLSTYLQRCDVDYRPADTICKGQPALMSLLVSPRLRF